MPCSLLTHTECVKAFCKCRCSYNPSKCLSSSLKCLMCFQKFNQIRFSEQLSDTDIIDILTLHSNCHYFPSLLCQSLLPLGSAVLPSAFNSSYLLFFLWVVQALSLLLVSALVCLYTSLVQLYINSGGHVPTTSKPTSAWLKPRSSEISVGRLSTLPSSLTKKKHL